MALITPSQRFAALLSAKTLLTGGENTALFSKSSPPAPNPTPMIRIAEYILTGVDYRDTDAATAGDAHYSGYPEEEPEDTKEEPKATDGDGNAEAAHRSPSRQSRLEPPRPRG